MKIITHKGTHYPYLIPIGLPLLTKKDKTYKREAKFMFNETCLYDLVDKDHDDVNKLYGFSIGQHNKDTSFRFGWRPLLDKGTIEIFAYEYHDGVRQRIQRICEVKLGEWCDYKIIYKASTGVITYTVTNFDEHYIENLTNIIDVKKSYGWGYSLGVYFGENEKAPQTIVINKKVVNY